MTERMNGRAERESAADAPVLACAGLGRAYRDGGLEVEVLRDVEFALPRAEAAAVVGASGSGKTTLLNLLGGLDAPSRGRVLFLGRDWARLSEAARCALRNRELGFVYQFHHLLGEFSAAENVAMPPLIAGEPKAKALAKAADWLERVGLGARLRHRPAQLSGGERQRVAIARALVMEPACVLLDEPTGNLDPAASSRVLALIDELKALVTSSFVIVTHDRSIAARADAVYELRGGGLHRLAASSLPNGGGEYGGMDGGGTRNNPADGGGPPGGMTSGGNRNNPPANGQGGEG